MPPPPSTYAQLNDKLRRILLTVGLGWFTAWAGGFLAAPVVMSLRTGGLFAHAPLLGYLLVAVCAQVWVWALLPAFGYALARAAPLSPWGFALGAAVSGELSYVAIDWVTSGTEGWTRNRLALAVRGVALVGGVLATRQAILRARRQAAATEARAVQASEAKRAEYEAFLRESERLAERARPEGVAPVTEPEPPSGEPRETETKPPAPSV